MRLQRLAVLLIGSTLVMTWSGDVQAQDGTDHGLESVLPAELGGRPVDYTFTSGQEAISPHQAVVRDEITRIVESQGASVADVRRATASLVSGDGKRINIEGFQIIGTDAKAWTGAYSLWLVFASGVEARIQEREVGGKDVSRITDPTDPSWATFTYFTGDTAWVVNSGAPLPPLLFEAIRRIPVPGGALGSGLSLIQDRQFIEDSGRSDEEAYRAYMRTLAMLEGIVGSGRAP